MKTGCLQVEDNLIDYVERKVPESLRGNIEDHLDRCLECARLVERFMLVWDAFPEEERVTPPESLWPDLWERIRSYDKPRKVDKRVFDGLVNSLRPVAAALLLLLGVFFGFHLGNFPAGAPEKLESAEIDPHGLEEIFVTEYFQDFQDFPLGSIGDAYMSFEIQSGDDES
jgi:hypothetical protein